MGVLELDSIMQGSLQSFSPSQLKKAGRRVVERKGRDKGEDKDEVAKGEVVDTRGVGRWWVQRSRWWGRNEGWKGGSKDVAKMMTKTITWKGGEPRYDDCLVQEWLTTAGFMSRFRVLHGSPFRNICDHSPMLCHKYPRFVLNMSSIRGMMAKAFSGSNSYKQSKVFQLSVSQVFKDYELNSSHVWRLSDDCVLPGG